LTIDSTQKLKPWQQPNQPILYREISAKENFLWVNIMAKQIELGKKKQDTCCPFSVK